MSIAICCCNLLRGENIVKCGFVENNYFAAHFTIYPEYNMLDIKSCFINDYCNKSPHSGMVSLVYDIIGIGNILENHKINIGISYKKEPGRQIYSWCETPVNGVIWKRVYLNPGSYVSTINIFCDNDIIEKLNKLGIFVNERYVNFSFPFQIENDHVLLQISYKVIYVLFITIAICIFIGALWRMVQNSYKYNE
ncbi:hypothetical protein A7Q10_03785 [Methylacidiphilum caldifontis]|uniref:Uncharacterized protein n=1 Tax=Methylacidiphilum caldifontis TaxID=2795386 RepID=A0A4Y8PHB5_9BACT|nr:hypothetical protein A7Q10_03785 [Methylacidiphilum caldifontis]